MDERLAGFPAPERVPEPALDRLPWGWTTPVVLAGRHAMRVRTTSTGLGGHVEALLSGFPRSDAPPSCTYSVVEGVNGHPDWWAVYAGDRRISTVPASSAALTHLFAHVNRAVVARAPQDAVPLHAAACALGDRAVLLTGPSESGKSTLAAALAQQGLRYLTDEVAVVDAARLDVAPYAKPLSIDRGSWGVLPGLEPDPGGPPHALTHQWHVGPHRLSGGVATSPVAVRLVVQCRWRAGADLHLAAVPAAGAVAALALDMFRPRERLLHQVQVLARLLGATGAHELVYSALPEAVDALTRLLRDA
ncbi:MAG: hypothetical protein JWL64_1183 [Frankiales bacterium]|nr:hypothetical protein [Frankiales bacterium]